MFGRKNRSISAPKRDGSPITIAFPARKGGVGKTTIAGNTAAMLANEGCKVLVVGTDAQEDVSEKFLSSLNDFDMDEHGSLYDVLASKIPVANTIVSTPEFKQYVFSNKSKLRRKLTGGSYQFDVIPAGKEIDTLVCESVFGLKDLIQRELHDYDYVIFDTPPSESEAVMLVLMASDYAVIPVTDRASFKSVQMVLEDIELARENDSEIECLGVIINNQHGARKLDKFNEELFRESIGDLMFDTIIRSSSSIPNADAYSVPLCSFEQVTQGLEDFYAFYEEFKTRIHNHEEGR